MSKKVVVMSLGGSLIVPDEIDFKFLKKFKKVVRKHYNNYKFVAVCGGGSVARTYIEGLKKNKNTQRDLSDAGIAITRVNAKFMTRIFGEESNDKIPKDMKQVKAMLRKNSIVFCGALRYHPNMTSDGTAADIADYLKSPFINITNVKGLFTQNPKTNKNAKFIPRISLADFYRTATKIKFKAGQHFVLDQSAAKEILKNNTKTYIIGTNLKNLDRILKNKKFTGTLVS